MRVPSGGELTFARLAISSSLIYPGGNLRSLSSIMVTRSFSKVTPFPVVYAHPHSTAKFSISVMEEASWRGPVQSGPTTVIEVASYCSICTSTRNLPQFMKSKSLGLATTLAMTNKTIITDTIFFSMAQLYHCSENRTVICIIREYWCYVKSQHRCFPCSTT